MAEAVGTYGTFAHLLKEWRQHRRVSQLALAGQSGISQRHISFLETGRSNPSRQMVVALCDALDVPLRERNTLLSAAGFAAMYGHEPLDHEHLAFFRETLGTVIDHHEPYPAVVLDGQWNVVMTNGAAAQFFSLFVAPERLLGAYEDFGIIRACLDEDGLKPCITNWRELVGSLLKRCRRALSANPKDERFRRLIDEILAHPDAPAAWQRPDPTPVAPVLDMSLEKDGRRYALFTMHAHFGSPEHITLEELSVEVFYPADEVTRRHFHASNS